MRKDAGGVRISDSFTVRVSPVFRMCPFDQEKKTLDPFDDKRHILENGCDTLAHGHHRIKSIEDINAKKTESTY